MTDALFMQTYNTHKKTVYSVIFNYTKNHDDASDLAQEVFIKFYSQTMEWKSDEHIKAWLIRVAINLCKNHLRERNRFIDEQISEELPAKPERERDELLQEVLKLPEKYRIPLHLFYYEDYSIAQISVIMELPEATIKTRLNRGRDKLRKTLRKEEWM